MSLHDEPAELPFQALFSQAFACASGKSALCLGAELLPVCSGTGLFVSCVRCRPFLSLRGDFLLIMLFFKLRILSSSLVQSLSFLCVLFGLCLKIHISLHLSGFLLVWNWYVHRGSLRTNVCFRVFRCSLLVTSVLLSLPQYL